MGVVFAQYPSQTRMSSAVAADRAGDHGQGPAPTALPFLSLFGAPGAFLSPTCPVTVVQGCL